MKLKRLLCAVLCIAMVLGTMGFSVFAEDAPVAQVGATKYATIDEAIANWTNDTTLTLLSNVTLSDVIKLSSTEHHILDLGTYTMTAASGKDAIQYVINGRSSAGYALDIKADATNPGGITATGKTIVSHIKPSSGAPDKDRPITRFYGGVFNASYVVKQGSTSNWGFMSSGYTGASAPSFQFYGGEFNGTIYTNRSLNQFYGGTFNGSMQMSVDSSAYTLVAGGTFKNLSNSFGSSLNSDKFTIGSAKGVYDKEVYIDDKGNYVIAAAEPAEGIEAAVAKAPGTNDYLAYSKVATEGELNYTDVNVALDKNKTATVTVYVDELDLTGSTFKGTIVVPEGKTLSITNAPEGLKVVDTDGNDLVAGDDGTYAPAPACVATVNGVGYETLASALAAAQSMTGDVTVEIYNKVTLNQSIAGSYDSIKFVGKAETAEIYLDVQGYITATGKTVAFEDLKLSKVAGGFVANAGFMNLAFGVYDVNTVSYTNCIFLNGAYASSGANTFTNCTFYRSYDKYGLWAYGNVDTVVEGCTFADYRGIKMYAEGAAKTTNLTVKNTNFAAVNDKPAIVLTSGESVTLENNTYSSTGVFELDLDGAPNGTPVTSDVDVTCVNDNGACGVLVDGKIYTTVAQAAAVATEGNKVTLLHNSTETVEFAEGVILDKNNYTADGVTVKVTAVAKIGDTTYTTIAEALAAAQAGDEIVLLADVECDINVPADVIFNGNGFAVKGTLCALGNITFAGHTKIAVFDFENVGTEINIGVGACLEITGTGRMVIGHGCTFNIEGNITDAKTANVADLTPSLIMPGASFTGAGVTFNVKNAYIKTTASYCSSSSSASGTFDFNIENSIWEQFGKLAFESQSTAATVNFDLKDSVLTTTSHLVFGVSRGEIVIDNSNVNVGTSRQIENQSTMIIKNGSVVNGAVATSSNAKNPGTIIVEDATYAVTGEFSGSDLGIGTIIVNKDATFSAGSITKANIIIDAAGLTAGKVDMIDSNLSKFAGELSVINNTLGAKIENGNIVLVVKPVAKIGETEYATLEEALAAVADGDTLTLLDDVTIDYDWNRRSHIPASITIDGDEHTITFNCSVNDGYNYYSAFHFTKEATVKNLKIDMTNATGWGMKIRAISTTSNLIVDNCTFIGNGSENNNRAIIFGEGAGDNLGNLVISITNSTFNNWRRGVSDSEAGKDVKSVTLTGNTFNDAAVYVSATDTVTFTGNTVTGAYVDIRSYTEGNALNVTATGNTLEANSDSKCNYIEAGGNVIAQDDFVLPATPVAKIGETEYATLEEAFAAATEGQTITLLSDATPVLISQRAITKAAEIDLNGNTITLTEDDLYFGTTTFKNGNIIVDPSVKPSTAVFWMFANQTLTFDNVKLTATGVTGTYLIGLDGNNADLNLLNSSEIIVNNATALDLDIICVNSSSGNDIVIDNSKVNVTNLDGRVFFRGNYVISGTSDIDLSGITKAGFRIEAGQTLDIKDTATVDIVGEPRDGGIHITDATATYTVANTATVNATVNAPVVAVDVAEVDGVKYTDLQAAIDAANAGDIVTLLENIELSETVTIPAGKTLTLDLNGKTVSMIYAEDASANHTMIHNWGNLTIQDSATGGKLSYKYTGANLGTTYSANTITSDYGSVLTVKSGTVENLTYDSATIAYAIDGLTNGNGGDVTINIEGGTITSQRQSVRIFANSTTKTGTLNISGGDITGRVIVQNANANANKAALNISGGTFNTNAYKAEVLYVGGSNGATIDMMPSITNGTFNGEIYSAMTAKFITGGTFVSDVTEYLADGYVLTTNADGTYGVVADEAGMLDKLLVIFNMDKVTRDNVTYYPVHVYAGIDTLNYKEVGFKVNVIDTDDNTSNEKTLFTTTVYETMRVTDLNGEVTSYKAVDLNGNYMFGQELLFTASNWSNDNTVIYITAYAIKLDGTPIYGETKEMSDTVIKLRYPDLALFKEEN